MSRWRRAISRPCKVPANSCRGYICAISMTRCAPRNIAMYTPGICSAAKEVAGQTCWLVGIGRYRQDSDPAHRQNGRSSRGFVRTCSAHAMIRSPSSRVSWTTFTVHCPLLLAEAQKSDQRLPARAPHPAGRCCQPTVVVKPYLAGLHSWALIILDAEASVTRGRGRCALWKCIGIEHEAGLEALHFPWRSPDLPRLLPTFTMLDFFAKKGKQEKSVQVQNGEYLGGIAAKHGVSVEELMRVNGLRNANKIQVGQILIIPGGAGKAAHRKDEGGRQKDVLGSLLDLIRRPTVTVAPGDSLWSISHAYGVSVEALRKENSLPEGLVVCPGQDLYLPRPERKPLLSFASLSQSLHEVVLPELSSAATKAAVEMPLVGPIIAAKRRQMPMRRPVHGGWLSSPYGWRAGRSYFHNGVDIAVEVGTPITSAHDGKVTYAGWMSGYGITLCVDHGNGLETLYAHCNELYVKKGDRVNHGEVIGETGDTGRSTGPHLHFEVRMNGNSEDPAIMCPEIYTSVPRRRRKQQLSYLN
eukprot:jgi/Mesvir1/28245/Mv04786-RA.1